MCVLGGGVGGGGYVNKDREKGPRSRRSATIYRYTSELLLVWRTLSVAFGEKREKKNYVGEEIGDNTAPIYTTRGPVVHQIYATSDTLVFYALYECTIYADGIVDMC